MGPSGRRFERRLRRRNLSGGGSEAGRSPPPRATTRGWAQGVSSGASLTAPAHTSGGLAGPSTEPVEGGEGAKGLEGGGAIVRVLPPAGLGRGHDSAEDDLAAATAEELVSEPRESLDIEIGEHPGRLFVVLVLEPREAPHPAEHRAEPRRVLLPGCGPPLFVGVLGACLEQEPDAVPRHGDLEVAVLLVPAPVWRERYPRVVRRVDGAARVLRDVGERLRAGRARDVGQKAPAQCLEPRPDAPPD